MQQRMQMMAMGQQQPNQMNKMNQAGMNMNFMGMQNMNTGPMGNVVRQAGAGTVIPSAASGTLASAQQAAPRNDAFANLNVFGQ